MAMKSSPHPIIGTSPSECLGSYCYIVICIYMQNGSQRHNDKGRAKTPLENIYLSIYFQGSKGLCGFYCERELETEHNCNILTPTLMAVRVVSFSFSRAAQPEAQGPSSLLDDGFLYCILSPTGLVPNSSGAPRVPSAWRGFPYHISSLTPTLSDFLSSLSYIIVQRPLNRALNPWNGTFDRHQAEITVMQFRGHSLPVHQSMSVPWDFFLPCPISSAKSRQRDFFRLLAIGMCHFLPVHHLGMAYLPRSKVKIQQYPEHLLVCVCVWGVLPLCREAVGVFFSPSRLSYNIYD